MKRSYTGKIASKTDLVDYDTIAHMSADQLKQVLPRLAKTANRRLRRLEESGRTGATEFAYRYAQNYAGKRVHPRFATDKAIQNMNMFELQHLLRNLQLFLGSRTSTLSGLSAMQRETTERFQKKGFDVGNPDKFYSFLHSNEFKRMKSELGSPTVFEDYAERLSAGISPEDIMRDYKAYLQQNELTATQLTRMRRKAMFKRQTGISSVKKSRKRAKASPKTRTTGKRGKK